jgi:hypothetical protein
MLAKAKYFSLLLLAGVAIPARAQAPGAGGMLMM